MWTRREIKTRAKAVLNGKYWKAFLVSVVIALSQYSGEFSDSESTRSAFESVEVLVISIIGLILYFVLRIFLGYPLEVGGRKYFIQACQYKNNEKCFRFAFDRKNYSGVVLTMLLKGIQNTLWFLLLIIPGIVKYYSYRMVPYILADNPNIGGKRAIELSNKMTKGHKFAMFILDLSFIGWYLLGLLVFVFGVFLVLPYVDTTYAELYLVLRKKAIDNNWSSSEELLLDRSAEEAV